ncbi:pol, partial [Mucuna pruriens]
MCDTSNSALGAVLGQRAGVGKPVHVIAYASRTMDSAQLNYTTTEKELLEIKSEIIKGAKNSVADHLSRIERKSDPMPIRDEFPNEQLLHINTPTPWFYYIWDDPYLWRPYNDQVIRRCIPDTEIKSVLQFCHAAYGGGHYGSTRTARKVLDCGFYWPTIFRDAYQFVSTYKKCQKAGMQPILFDEVFDVWGIDFMGPFPISNGYSYILLAVDYVSRCVEVIATKTNDGKVVVDFLKSNIFCRFGVPKALISDRGSHFCNRAMSALLHKYGVVH